MKKAFDTIDHRILVNKLSQYGVCDDSLKFFESYISERVQCCSVNGCTGSFRHISMVATGFHSGTTLIHNLHE